LVGDRQHPSRPAIPVRLVRFQPVTWRTPSRMAVCDYRNVSGKLEIFGPRAREIRPTERGHPDFKNIPALQPDICARWCGGDAQGETRISKTSYVDRPIVIGLYEGG